MTTCVVLSKMTFARPRRALKTVPRISDTEWEIMRIVWAQHPVTAGEVIAQLAAADPAWHPKTARTLLARLVRKQALGYEARGRTYVYSPLVSEQECVATASESFLDRVFGGSLQPMLAHFVERQKLTKEDLDELRKLLNGSPKTSTAKPRKKYGRDNC
jgi:BlaI family transcriptional regulator, penicillinase repressor